MGFGGNVSLTERLKRRADKCAEDGYERDSALLLLAAAEIESMRAQMFDNLETARAAIERLTAERDEARREACGLSFGSPSDHAKRRGWNCFASPGAKP